MQSPLRMLLAAMAMTIDQDMTATHDAAVTHDAALAIGRATRGTDHSTSRNDCHGVQRLPGPTHLTCDNRRISPKAMLCL